MKLAITVPKRIGQAPQAAADEFEMTAPEFLKSVLFAAGNLDKGYTFKLHLPPVPKAAEPELPLFEPQPQNESR